MSTTNQNKTAIEAAVSAVRQPVPAASRRHEKVSSGNWRQYAGILRANLEARKSTESALLEELKKANIQHPMATTEGFTATFKQMLDAQYGADQIAFDMQEAERMRKAVDEGSGSVS